MAYNPATDALAIFRNNGASYSKEAMPGLDVVVAALGRAGLLTVTVSATQPLANQNVTAWFRPAVPSYSGEGSLFLWDAVTTSYLPATMALLLRMLEVAAGQNGTSWFTTAGGPPANTVGNNGDFAIRMDFPGGTYGPKALGAWPVDPIPGTTYAVDSTALDASFGSTPGEMLYRAALTWQALAIGSANRVLVSSGAAPVWTAITAVLDSISATRGSILYRGAATWNALAPGTAGYLLASQGAGADPTYVIPGAEFSTGTVMVFRQTAAPTNWTKQTSVNDAGLRVTNGTIGSGGTVGFNTLFATTAVANTTLSTAQIPSHSHPYTGPSGSYNSPGGATNVSGFPSGQVSGNTGGDGAHTHALDLRLAYVDIIIATKN